LNGARLERLNAARISAAGEGGAPRSEFKILMIAGGQSYLNSMTEPILYLRRKAQMQTSLAT